MINKKVSTIAGSLIIIAIVIALGFSFLASNKKEETQNQNSVVLNNSELGNKEEVRQDEENKIKIERDAETANNSMEDLEIYADKLYGFEFKYPKKYLVEAQSSPFSNEYFVKDNSDTITHIKLRRWNGYIIQEGTPGTEAEKRAHSRWKYFSDNLSNLKSGNCDDKTVNHVPGPTMSDAPRTCIMDKQADYIKIETESSVIYYTKTLEIYWDSAPQNFDLMKKIVSTFKISENENDQKEIIMENVSFCGKIYKSEKVIINNINIAESVAKIANEKNLMCKILEMGKFQESGIGIFQKKEESKNNSYLIVFFHPDNQKEKDDPLNQSSRIFRFDFDNDKIYFQSQFDAKFNYIGNIK